MDKLGIRSVALESGPAGLAAMEQTVFDLLLVDLGMPEMDGLEVVRRVKRRWPEGCTRIVMLSPLGASGDVAQCRDLGVDARLSKPIVEAELLDTVRSLFTETPGGRPSLSLTIERKAPVDSGARFNVLLAEDNAINQLLVRRMLEKQGHTVRVVTNGRSAVEACETASFDVILMDIQMPELDGIGATAAIRKRESGRPAPRRTPIVALTANAMTGDRERYLEAGMDGYCSKPVQMSDLLAMLSAVCGESASGR